VLFTEGEQSTGGTTLLTAVTGGLELALGIVLGQRLTQPAHRRIEGPGRQHNGPRLLGAA
jgi:hypothetical protein